MKACRLELASRCYFGGGGAAGGIDMRSWLGEKPDIRNAFNFSQKQLDRYGRKNPLINQAEKGALSFWDQLPGMLSQFKGFGNELQGYQGQLGGLYNELGGYRGDLTTTRGQLGEQASTLGSWLNAPQGAAATIAGGGYSPYMGRMGSQGARIFGAQSGTLRDPGAAVREYQQREDVRQANYGRALQQGQGILQQQSGIYGQQAGITGQQAGITGMQQGNLAQQSGLVGQRAGLLGQEQGLQTGALNQLTGVQQAKVSGNAQTKYPFLSYLGNLFSGNQQAQVAGAQISAGESAAKNAATASMINAAMSSIGQAVGGISDERLKQKIKETGLQTAEGIPLKIYEFKTRPGVKFIGPMAQDVEKVRPDAVRTDEASGVKMIDFWKIRAPMIELKALGKEAA